MVGELDLTQRAALAKEALAERAKEAQGKEQLRNPEGPAQGRRIPLSVPQRKLEVPNIPGYFSHWFRGTPQRIAQAQRAGFEFVSAEEVGLPPGGDAKKDGNTDLGGRVSVEEGGEVATDGQAVRMYLMKQRMEYYLEDQAIIQQRNDQVAASLTNSYRQGTVGGPAPGETADDASHRYVDPRRSRIPDLFRKKG